MTLLLFITILLSNFGAGLGSSNSLASVLTSFGAQISFEVSDGSLAYADAAC